MKKLFQKPLSKIQDSHSSSSSSSPQGPLKNTIAPPTPTDVLRYRYHNGVNLGSVFVLEKWLSGSMFVNGSTGDSELDAVSASLKKDGLEPTKKKWEAHWRNAVTEQDFEWLVKEAKVTSLRVPIGFFTLGPGFCKGTKFEGVKEIYVNAWAAVKELIGRARAWGIGILLDLHALPGGANGSGHSGTTSGKAELWGDGKNLGTAKRAAVFIAQEVHRGGQGMEDIIGIQLINEAAWGAKGMYSWYDEVIKEIGNVDKSIPVYISDGWDMKRCLEWTNKRNVFGKGPSNPVVVDTHKYYTFSEADRSQSPQEIIGRIGGELEALNGREGNLNDRGEAQVIIGEWSCVLDGKTWGRVMPQDKEGLVRQFGAAQSKKWQERAGGSYFWTYKMDWMDGGEWGFVEQVKKGNIFPPIYLTLSSQEIKNTMQSAQERRAGMAEGAKGSHEDYWNRSSPGQSFQHHLYGEGWDVGFSDAQKFFTMRAEGALGDRVTDQGGDKIGCLEIWVKKRLLESGQRGDSVWQWEQGFRAGVRAFNQCVGI